MFSFFKKKSPMEKLQAKHDQLIKEAYELSSKNRTASDAKSAEAHEIMKQMEALSSRN